MTERDRMLDTIAEMNKWSAIKDEQIEKLEMQLAMKEKETIENIFRILSGCKENGKPVFNTEALNAVEKDIINQLNKENE